MLADLGRLNLVIIFMNRSELAARFVVVQPPALSTSPSFQEMDLLMGARYADLFDLRFEPFRSILCLFLFR